MEKRTLKLRIKQNPALKQVVHRFIMHPVKTRSIKGNHEILEDLILFILWQWCLGFVTEINV